MNCMRVVRYLLSTVDGQAPASHARGWFCWLRVMTRSSKLRADGTNLYKVETSPPPSYRRSHTQTYAIDQCATALQEPVIGNP